MSYYASKVLFFFFEKLRRLETQIAVGHLSWNPALFLEGSRSQRRLWLVT